MPLSRLEPGVFVRGAGTDPAHVQMLVEAASSCTLPAILVQQSSSRIVDGMHRFEAAKLRGEETIRVRLINCTDEDAFILAVKANTWHGLPLSRADRMAGAKQIVEWHPDWSDRAIGAATGLSAKTIAGIRRQSADDGQRFGKRLGRDGKRRPLTAAEGRRRAAEYIAIHPDASLREIAREADVAPATAQDVRARIRRGADPIATRRTTRSLKNSNHETGHSSTLSPLQPWPPTRPNLPSSAVRRPPTWSALSPKLANDPSLKYAQRGRAFIGWMAMHVINSGEWKEFIDAIPVHWLPDLSLIADQTGQDWMAFAEELRRRQEVID
ncbi:ParB-like chromosome segregation protein Spo0J [Thermocatellispora tengchongensis]|uniref:ParB-like chromosome segregation protein Spo0J n=1 Tax=Thermocatellispora tengchongensis TaxID=1073253 RepID=A0A840PE74_9ACTN|nr:ParB N-terminal domain-containing protein [Thermocatellispora tengchongensis]MBB5137482.1 ParB-like chromosome segregation protein Spo0J [Thermocatellispora tengchongensis]